MPIDMEKAVAKLKDRIASGILFLGSAFATEWTSERLARRYTKEYSELAVGLGTAVVYDMLGLSKYVGAYDKYVEDIIDGMSDYGFMKSLLDYKILKKPICWFSDANTIHCMNFDADTLSSGGTTYVTVYVDDEQASVSAVSGEPASFDISLANPVSGGWHKLVVEAGNAKKDVFRTKRAYVKA